jgi:N-formylglutamate deformylase
MTQGWELSTADSPLVATAIHDGHHLRDSLLEKVALSEEERLREEDPWTARWLRVSDCSVRVHRSRFECDLNRPLEGCVYQTPRDAWGLQVWKHPLTNADLELSRRFHEAFYDALDELLSQQVRRFGAVLVYDLHSYNHRRQGPQGPPSPPDRAPEVNIGTGSLDRRRWGKVVDAFLNALRSYDFLGRPLDVRENINFRGGYLPRWTHERFGSRACALAIEVKKFFMDEWTGQVDLNLLEEVGHALQSTVPASLGALFESHRQQPLASPAS